MVQPMVKKLRAVVTSDWHLDGMNRYMPNANNRIADEIHKPFRYALANGIKHVIIPGDASDTPTLSERAFIILLTLLLTYDSSLCIWYILGNHDMHSREKSSMDVLKVMVESGMFKNFKLIYSPELHTIDGVEVAFVPFPFLEVPKSKKPPLVFAHIETVGAIGDNGLPLRMKEDSFKRQKGDYIISGHIHQYQVLKKKRFLYCGSLFQRNFGERLPKGFIEIDARYGKEGGLLVDHTFVNSKPGFTLETVRIECDEDWEKIPKDENIRVKLLVSRGLVVPKGLTTTYPNIVMVNGVDSTQKVAINGNEDDEGALLTDVTIPKVSVTTGLLPFLKKSGLEKKDRILARKLVGEAINSLSIHSV